MANNPITVPLPQDLPETWATNQVVSPDGVSAGLTPQHGYNYLMQQVNNAQKAAQELGEGIAGLSGDNLPASSDGGETISAALSNKADKEQPQGYDLPLENGWDVYGICKYWRTQDGMCFVNIGAHSTTPPGTEQVILATLPEGFRPSANVYAPACVSFPRVSGDLQINPDGQIIYTWATLENETYISSFFGFLVNQP